MSEKILVVENDESLLLTFKHILCEEGYDAVAATCYDGAMAAIESQEFTAIIADIVLGGKSGIDILRSARSQGLQCPFIIMTGHPEIETASQAVRMDAFDYLVKPVDKNGLLTVAKKATEHYRLKTQNERYRKNLDAIFRCAQEGIIMVDGHMNILEANDAVRKICEIQPECRGKKVAELHLSCSARCTTALQETIETRQPQRIYRFECAHTSRKGRVVTITTSPIEGHKNAPEGAIAVIRDETRIVELEKGANPENCLQRLIGSSRPMRELFSLIRTLSSVQSTVLITGESGTGKELAAEAMHYLGPRSGKPIVKVNCPALKPELLESELFGHVRGAFTGAATERVGRFEHANGGTVFLDEIAELSLDTQSKLLRVLQERTIERVGDHKEIHVDVRILAATNRDLREYVQQGRFREDLFYRLNVMNLRMPALRERKDDIPLLAAHFLQEYSSVFAKNIESFSADVLEYFADYAWPGNVRELRNCIEHACLLSNNSTITLDDLPSGLWQTEECRIKEPADNRVTIDMVRDMLAQCNGNKTEAARQLNISRRTIYRKIFGKENAIPCI